VGDWLVEPALCRITRGGRTTHLRPKLIDLLVFLASAPGRVIGKDGKIANAMRVLLRAAVDRDRDRDGDSVTLKIL
jgi:predicted RNA-binding protein YlqC (UPF0109 family)